jgi:hypothetical protein
MYTILARIPDDQSASVKLHKYGRLVLNKILEIKYVQMVWSLQMGLEIVEVRERYIFNISLAIKFSRNVNQFFT